MLGPRRPAHDGGVGLDPPDQPLRRDPRGAGVRAAPAGRGARVGRQHGVRRRPVRVHVGHAGVHHRQSSVSWGSPRRSRCTSGRSASASHCSAPVSSAPTWVTPRDCAAPDPAAWIQEMPLSDPGRTRRRGARGRGRDPRRPVPRAHPSRGGAGAHGSARCRPRRVRRRADRSAPDPTEPRAVGRGLNPPTSPGAVPPAAQPRVQGRSGT